MTSRRLFWAAIVVLTLTLGMHAYAHVRELYFALWWLDIPMHFFGGVGVGFLGLWLAVWSKLLPAEGALSTQVAGVRIIFSEGVPWWWSLGIAVVAISIVAPYWEQIEGFVLAYLGKPIPEGYIADTVLDYIMDYLGAVTAWAAFYHGSTRVQWKAWQEAKATAPASIKRN